MMQKKFLRMLSSLLCLLMLLSALASCTPPASSGGNEQTSGVPEENTSTSAATQVSYQVADYTIFRPSDASVAMVSCGVAFRDTLKELTGITASLKEDWVMDPTTIPDDACEILIGATNRKESAEALEGIEDNRFVIKVEGKRIIINATVESILNDAIEYFFREYVEPTVKEGTFSLPENLYYRSEAYESSELMNGLFCNYKVIYAEGLDNQKSSNPDSKDVLDYPVQMAINIRTAINDTFSAVKCELGDDWYKKGTDISAAYEILVGQTNREETAAFLQTLAPNEYGYAVINHKIVVAGWSDATTGYAADLFISMLKGSAVKKEDNTKNLTLIHGTKQVASNKNWNADIPLFQGGTLAGCLDGMRNCYEAYYTDATAEEFRTYRTEIEAAGYTLYFENELVGNLYATYTNRDTMLHVYYVDAQKAVRVVTEPLADADLPNVKEETYEKITTTKVTQMRLDYGSGNFGMCYIITLEDGSFVIYDGGGSTGKDCERLYNLLIDLNESKDGIIHIAAWILTHEHWDHFMNFYNFLTRYRGKYTLDQFICNTGSALFVQNSGNPNYYANLDKTSSQLANLMSIMPNLKIVRVHTGQKFVIRNLTFEVLYTLEDLYPQRLYIFNNTSMITRVNIEGQLVTFLGDIQTQGCKIVSAMYGSALKCDIVQVAHHGYDGATTELYQLLSPSVLLWPTNAVSQANQTSGEKMTGYYGVDYHLARQKGVLQILVADETNKTLLFPYKANDATRLVERS